MQIYQFERIIPRMAKEYGKMRKGEEDKYAALLYAMESNALAAHRINPRANSLRMSEAIALVLFDIQAEVTGEAQDVEEFRTEENGVLEQALRMALDPNANPKLAQDLGPMTRDELRDYVKVPVMCLLRIKDSIDLWERKNGSDGYFTFLESAIGPLVETEAPPAAEQEKESPHKFSFPWQKKKEAEE